MIKSNSFKIFFISLVYPPYIGGAEKQISLLCEELVKRNIEVNIFTIHHINRNNINNLITAPFIGVKVNKLNKLIWFIYLLFQLFFINSKNAIIYSCGSSFYMYIIYIISKLKSVPYITKIPATIDGNIIKKIKYRQYNPLKYLQYKIMFNSNKLIVQDNVSRINLVNCFNVKKKNIVLIQNGVKINRYKKTKQIRKLLFIGRIIKEKGVFELIEAFRILKKSYSELTLTVVGDGKDKCFINKNISGLYFVGYSNEVEKYYFQSDLFVFPSFFFEGLPNVVLEAMSFGLPVVCSNSGALSEIFEDNIHLFYIKKKNINNIIDKFKYLYFHPEIAENVSFNAYNKLKEGYTMDKNCSQYIKLFNSVKNERN